VPDAGLEAAGGIANLGRAVGDLRSLTTVTNVPGVYVTLTQTKLGVDPDFGGTRPSPSRSSCSASTADVATTLASSSGSTLEE